MFLLELFPFSAGPLLCYKLQGNYTFLPYSVQDFNAITTCQFSICYKVSLRLFARFKYLQIMKK